MRMKNTIKGVFINAKWCEEPSRMKKEIKRIFHERFSERVGIKVRLDSIEFCKLDGGDN